VTPDENVWTERDKTPFPEWVTGFRPHQTQAVEEIIDHFDSGTKVVFLDAPTGAGKTLIGEMVRRRVSTKALYVCHSLGLQDQFVRDFPYAKVLKGRANYPTLDFPTLTAESCDLRGAECSSCARPNECPYSVAKEQAISSRLAVVNTAYALAELNGPAKIGEGRDLTIVDEADTLEQVLIGRCGWQITTGGADRLGVELPKKGSKQATWQRWLRSEVARLVGGRLEQADDPVIQRRLKRQLAQIGFAERELEQRDWIRDNGYDGFRIVPSSVARFGQGLLWRHSGRWLLMSATLISTNEMCLSLGLDKRDAATVRVPMTFPVSNRPVLAVRCADMRWSKEHRGVDPAEFGRLVAGIEAVLARHPDERILIHTVSYRLALDLQRAVRTARRTFTYGDAGSREPTVASFKETDSAVLFAPSVDRGYDFKGDEARVVVVAKLPWANVKDPVVSARLHGSDSDQEWYMIQMLRGLVQMTGRGVRSADDWAVTYILDSGFLDLRGRVRELLPDWWTEALNTEMRFKDLCDPTWEPRIPLPNKSDR